MKRKINTTLMILLVAVLVFSTLSEGSIAAAASSIYVNDSQNVLSGDLSSAYAVGGTGTISVTGGTYAITGDGVVQVGQSSTIPVPTTAPDGANVVVKQSTARIGLYYKYSATRDTSLATASLENKVGSGYKFGYYDSSRTFYEVGNTALTQLTMVPDVNTTVSAGIIGCYHIKLFGTYTDFNSAQSVASQYTGAFPAYINGTYFVMFGNYQSATEAEAAKASLGVSGEVFTGSSGCVKVTKTGTTNILFEFDAGTSAKLAVRPVSTSGKAITWFKGYSYYGDFEYYRYLGGKLTVINILPVEDYVKGVIPYEMSPSWPLEALKAQALCARTFYAANSGMYSNYGFDITADDYSQVYKGTSGANSNTDSAVDVTAGRYITYNGKFCTTFFFSSDGGGTEDSENVFTAALPYCRGVIDPFEEAVPATMNTRKSWSKQFTSAELLAKVNGKGYSLADIASVTPTYSDTNNVIALIFADSTGKTAAFSKSSCYSFCTGTLALNSIHVTISQDNGTHVFSGSGWGHNVGMSQWGAYSMATNYSYNCRQIIGFYFTGANISLGV
ncbi:MAG: SpoIID/LytB domain-containing protein [Oscillospiraceae bacterium]|nr:SpoIID/LytB domain-containing protein [Oscillospiraceae bacterium]